MKVVSSCCGGVRLDEPLRAKPTAKWARSRKLSKSRGINQSGGNSRILRLDYYLLQLQSFHLLVLPRIFQSCGQVQWNRAVSEVLLIPPSLHRVPHPRVIEPKIGSLKHAARRRGRYLGLREVDLLLLLVFSVPTLFRILARPTNVKKLIGTYSNAKAIIEGQVSRTLFKASFLSRKYIFARKGTLNRCQ